MGSTAVTPGGETSGAVALPINGATWQVMRLSRNRNWGHPKLIAFLERLGHPVRLEFAHAFTGDGLLPGLFVPGVRCGRAGHPDSGSPVPVR